MRHSSPSLEPRFGTRAPYTPQDQRQINPLTAAHVRNLLINILFRHWVLSRRLTKSGGECFEKVHHLFLFPCCRETRSFHCGAFSRAPKQRAGVAHPPLFPSLLHIAPAVRVFRDGACAGRAVFLLPRLFHYYRR